MTLPQQRSKIRLEAGKGTLGCLFSLLMLSVMVYVGWKFGPPYVQHHQLKREMKEIAIRSAVGRIGSGGAATTAMIKETVLVAADDFGVPLSKRGIKVRLQGGLVYITVKYTVPIDLPTGVFDYQFEFTTHN